MINKLYHLMILAIIRSYLNGFICAIYITYGTLIITARNGKWFPGIDAFLYDISYESKLVSIPTTEGTIGMGSF